MLLTFLPLVYTLVFWTQSCHYFISFVSVKSRQFPYLYPSISYLDFVEFVVVVVVVVVVVIIYNRVNVEWRFCVTTRQFSAFPVNLA